MSLIFLHKLFVLYLSFLNDLNSSGDLLKHYETLTFYHNAWIYYSSVTIYFSFKADLAHSSFWRYFSQTDMILENQDTKQKNHKVFRIERVRLLRIIKLILKTHRKTEVFCIKLFFCFG